MTAIIIDKYKNEIFAFADGRLTRGDLIMTDTAEKVFRVDADTIWTGCGDMKLDETFKRLVETNQLNDKSVKELRFDGTFYVVKADEIIVVDSAEPDDNDTPSKSGMYKLSIDALPITDGSGLEALQAAYNTIQPNKAKSREEYLEKVKECFNKGCARVSSVGPYYSHKSVKIRY